MKVLLPTPLAEYTANRRETEASAWVKRSNTCATWASGMPTPVSVTSTRSRIAPSPAAA